MNKYINIILFSALISSYLYGQENSSRIIGQLLNPEYTAIENATVGILGINKSALTDNKGKYTLKVKPGNYTLVIQHLGFKTVYKKIEVKQDKTVTQNFKLEYDELLLDGVTLYTKKPIEKVRESAYNVVAIDAKALHNTTLDVAGALDRVSGIKVRSNGGEGSDVSFSMNGFSGRHIRFFMDGVPMQGFGESFRISNIPITLIDRIEVYKGVVPIEFGSDALGGVVNIITNKSKKTTLDASLGFGSFNTIKSNVNLNKVFKNDMLIQLNAFQNYSDNDYKVIAPSLDLKTRLYSEPIEVRRFNDNYINSTVIAKAGVQNKKYADKLLFGFTYGQATKGIQTGTEMKKVFGEKSRHSVTIMPSFEYYKNNLFTSNLNVSITANYNLGYTQNIDTSSYKYNWAGERALQLKIGESGGGPSLMKLYNNNAITTFNISYKISDKHSISANNVLQYFNRKTEDPFVVKETIAEKNSELSRKSLKNITSLSYKFNVLNNLSFSAFGKHFRVKHVFDGVPLNSSSTGYGVAGTYIYNDIQLKTSFEKTYRLPSNTELFGDGDLEWGDIKLRPEQGNNLNVNLSYSKVLNDKHSLFLDSGFAYRRMKDYIRRIVYGGGSRAGNENIAGVLSSGINVEARYIYDGTLQIGGTLTWQKIVNKQKLISGEYRENSFYNERMPNEPYLFGSADAAWTFKNVLEKGNNLLFGYNMRYIYKYTYDYESIGIGSNWIPKQLVHDLSLSYSFLKNTTHFTIEANNITNAKVYDNYSFQKPGRNFMFKLRYIYN